jgi:KUP system potassium uptake protein
MVFFHLRPLETPSVAPETRYTVTRVAIPNCYRLVVRHGYMDEVITPDLASLVCEQVRNYIVCQGAALKLKAANGNTTATTTSAQPREISFTPLPREEKGYSDPEKRFKTTEESIAMDLAKLQQAFDRQVLYIIGKEQMKIRGGTGIWRKILLKAFLWLRDNTRTKVANLRVQPDRVIEMGFVKEV